MLMIIANMSVAAAKTMEDAFGETLPPPSTLWLKADMKAELQNKFDYRLSKIRLRYWRKQAKTLWVLEEVGKEQPITMAIVVESGKIQNIEVLAYRESRGGEIKHRFFRKQFFGAGLVEAKSQKLKLNAGIDGITGATLSVRAMTKVAKVALFLTAHIESQSTNQ